MATTATASVMINSFNHGRFLRKAVDSALYQRYIDTEVAVADDGPTDNLRDMIASYGSAIMPVIKENAGQASAFNPGFRVSRGKVFLDSEDSLLPTVVEKAVKLIPLHW